jgi:DNA repair exonuclease SbcCD ATPase subunit
VKRSRKKGKPKLEVVDPQGNPIDASKEELQKKVVDWVGLDFEAFRNTVLYGQNDSFRFADPRTTDGQRKTMLHQVLRTGVLQRCHKLALDERKKLKSELSQAKGDLANIEARVEEHDIESLKSKRDEWEVERDADFKRILEEAKNDLFESKTWSKRRTKLPALRKKLKLLEKVASSREKLDSDIKATEERRRKALEERSSCKQELGEIEARRSVIIEQLEGLDGDRCPTCTSPLTKGEAKKYIAAQKKKANSEGGRQEVLFLALEEIEPRIETIDNELEDLKAKRKRQIESLESLVVLKAKVATFELAEERVEHYRAQAADKMAKAELVNEKENPWDEELKKAKKTVKEYRGQLKERRKECDRLAGELALVEFWVAGFSSQGLPSFVLDSVMPYLTERANHYLGTLADGDIIMTFATQRELKSKKGEVRDEIEIDWTIEGNDGVTPSGGQRKKMEIATDLALMDLVATQEGGHIDLLMLDEVLDGLDREGRGRVIMLLKELRKERGSVFVVSHEPDLSEAFEKTVKVMKRGGVSTLEVAA